MSLSIVAVPVYIFVCFISASKLHVYAGVGPAIEVIKWHEKPAAMEPFANGSLKSNQMQAQNRPKNVPKSSQNGSKIGPKSVPNGLRNRLRFQDRFGTDLEPILAPTWARLGGQDRAMLGPCWLQNRFLKVLDDVQKRT